MKMNKTGIYTLSTFLITVFLVAAGMAGMSKLMEYKESRILSQKGKLEAGEPARTWHELLETSINENKARLREAEDVVEAFNSNEKEITLEPGDEYIDGKTAIETAKVWIDSMDISKLFSEGGWLGECNATLVTRVADIEDDEYAAVYDNIAGDTEENTVAQIEVDGDGAENMEAADVNADPYYSYWLVEFVNGVSDIKLYVNAGSNAVWNARIILLDTFIYSEGDVQKYLDMYGSGMLDEFASNTGVVMLEQESDYFEKMGIDAGTGSISETVVEEMSGYSITGVGYDSDIYAMMQIGVINDNNLKNDDYTFSESIDNDYSNHIMVSYSLQL